MSTPQEEGSEQILRVGFSQVVSDNTRRDGEFHIPTTIANGWADTLIPVLEQTIQLNPRVQYGGHEGAIFTCCARTDPPTVSTPVAEQAAATDRHVRSVGADVLELVALELGKRFPDHRVARSDDLRTAVTSHSPRSAQVGRTAHPSLGGGGSSGITSTTGPKPDYINRPMRRR